MPLLARKDDAADQKVHSFTSSFDGGKAFARSIKSPETVRHPTGPDYPIPSASSLVEFGSRIALLSDTGGAPTAWTDTRHSSSDTFQQIHTSNVALLQERRLLYVPINAILGPGWRRSS